MWPPQLTARQHIFVDRVNTREQEKVLIAETKKTQRGEANPLADGDRQVAH
jgi:hypothetical protein